MDIFLINGVKSHYKLLKKILINKWFFLVNSKLCKLSNNITNYFKYINKNQQNIFVALYGNKVNMKDFFLFRNIFSIVLHIIYV